MNKSFFFHGSVGRFSGVGPTIAFSLLLAAALSSAEANTDVTSQLVLEKVISSTAAAMPVEGLGAYGVTTSPSHTTHRIAEDAQTSNASPWWRALPNKLTSVFQFQSQPSERVTVDRRYLRFDMRADSHSSLKWVHRGERPMPSSVGFSMRWNLGTNGVAGEPSTSFLVAME